MFLLKGEQFSRDYILGLSCFLKSIYTEKYGKVIKRSFLLFFSVASTLRSDIFSKEDKQIIYDIIITSFGNENTLNILVNLIIDNALHVTCISDILNCIERFKIIKSQTLLLEAISYTYKNYECFINSVITYLLRYIYTFFINERIVLIKHYLVFITV